MVGKYPQLVIYHIRQQIKGEKLIRIRYVSECRLQFQMSSSAASEMEQLREKIEENRFSCLKLYPNKSLLGKSKALRFTNNSDFFDQRCSLFMEVEAEQMPAFVSQHVFINHFGEVYLFYSFDPQHQGRLAKISPGGLVPGIVAAFHRFFPQAEEISDCEHQSLYQNAVHSLIPYFDDLRQKSEKYYYQTQESSYNCEFRYEPSNPYSVLVKLESSQLYKECNFPVKYNTAVLVRGVIDAITSKELQNHFINLSHDQEGMLMEANCLYSIQDVRRCVSDFYLKIFRYFQLLQKEAFLKVTVSQIDIYSALEAPKGNQMACCLTFQANLRKEAHINKTSNEKSSESSIRNDKQLTKEQKEKLIRVSEYLESLSIFKNKINFTVRLNLSLPDSAFEMEMEAVSLWIIDQIYYYHFLDFWGAFMNNWLNLSQKQDDQVDERISTFRFQLFHKNRNIGIKASLKLQKNSNIIQQLIVTYDQIAILFLLFEPTLKKMYKMGYQFINFGQKDFQQLRQPVFIENKISKLKTALKKYTKYYNELVRLTSR